MTPISTLIGADTENAISNAIGRHAPRCMILNHRTKLRREASAATICAGVSPACFWGT